MESFEQMKNLAMRKLMDDQATLRTSPQIAQGGGARVWWVPNGPRIEAIDQSELSARHQAVGEGVTSNTHETMHRLVHEAGEQAERTRILAALQDLKPPQRPRTHGDWARAWKEDGERAMWERVAKLIEGKE